MDERVAGFARPRRWPLATAWLGWLAAVAVTFAAAHVGAVVALDADSTLGTLAATLLQLAFVAAAWRWVRPGVPDRT